MIFNYLRTPYQIVAVVIVRLVAALSVNDWGTKT